MVLTKLRSLKLRKIDENWPTLLLLNGGGQPPFNKFHRMIRYLNQYELNLVALELPGHGNSAFSEIISTEEMLDNFYDEMKIILDRYNCPILFGYSLGGLLTLKATEHFLSKISSVITLGTPINVTIDQERKMRYYTTREFFEKMHWMPQMMEYHRNGWKELLFSVHEMLHIGSNIFANMDNLNSSKLSISMIFGDEDEVAPMKLHREFGATYDNVSVYQLDSTRHFDYFVSSWKKLRDCLDIIFQKLNIRKLED